VITVEAGSAVRAGGGTILALDELKEIEIVVGRGCVDSGDSVAISENVGGKEAVAIGKAVVAGFSVATGVPSTSIVAAGGTVPKGNAVDGAARVSGREIVGLREAVAIGNTVAGGITAPGIVATGVAGTIGTPNVFVIDRRKVSVNPSVFL
jgi:hypothetical protein